MTARLAAEYMSPRELAETIPTQSDWGHVTGGAGEPDYFILGAGRQPAAAGLTLAYYASMHPAAPESLAPSAPLFLPWEPEPEALTDYEASVDKLVSGWWRRLVSEVASPPRNEPRTQGRIQHGHGSPASAIVQAAPATGGQASHRLH